MLVRPLRLVAAVALVALALPGSALALGENGPLAYVSDRDGDVEIYAQNLDGSGLANLTRTPGVDQSPAWSGDGSRIAFTSFRDGGRQAIYVMNADGSEQRRVSPPTDLADDATPAWSPDGARIAFASTRPFGSGWGVWTMNADGTGLARVSDGFAVDPAWSPDGSLLAFSGLEPGSAAPGIYVVDANNRNGRPMRITSSPFAESAPSWSPDGRWLVFSRYRGGDVQELVIASPFQSGEQTITSGGFYDANAVWSPDMRWIVFQRHFGAASQTRNLWIVSTAGGDAFPLDNLPGANGEPDWSIRGAEPPPPPPPPDPAPQISIGIPFETSYLLGGSYATSFSCRDGDGPPPSCAASVTWDGGSADLAPGDPLPTGSVGPHLFAVKSRDAAGNVSTQERWYWVIYETTNVFAAPLAPFPQFADWKAGQELPVRFSITGFHGLDVLRRAPVSRDVSCASPEFGQWGDATSGKLHYNATNDRYTYVWETDRAWADTCRQFVLTLNDTSYWYAYVRFTR